jgi:hypothetical protein
MLQEKNENIRSSNEGFGRQGIPTIAQNDKRLIRTNEDLKRKMRFG